MALDIAHGRYRPSGSSLMHGLGDIFRDLARAYLVVGLEKGLPSLFVDVKGIYTSSPEKMAIIGEMLEEIISQLQRDNGLHDDGTSIHFVLRPKS